MATGLNQRYKAKYYKEGTLLQEGFVVINNTNGQSIKLNFIDSALSLTEKWGATNYRELLRSKTLPIDANYKTAIQEMESYIVDKTEVLPYLSNIVGEEVPIALFPNNLNCIGDKWQIYKVSDGVDGTEELRVEDSFNPYQSRPAFNVYAFLNIICTTYGYTPIFDSSIDWDVVKKTYMLSEGLSKGGKDNGGIEGTLHGFIRYGYNQYSSQTYLSPTATLYRSQSTWIFDSLTGIIPEELDSSINLMFFTLNGSTSGRFYTSRSLFQPDVTAGNVGTLKFTANLNTQEGGFKVYALYEQGTFVYGTPSVEMPIILDESDRANLFLDVTVDKASLNNVPDGYGPLIGIYAVLDAWGPTSDSLNRLSNMQVEETYLPLGIISYDEYGQFLADAIDLTYAASLDTISKIVNGIMHKEGMLMNIDFKAKEVEFFSYSKYKTNRDAGIFSDWSKYLQEYVNPNFNTTYGNNYAIVNKIGLSDPYPGNTSKILLGNQTATSKYKDFTENYLKYFGDIKTVDKILNPITPYTEFSVDGQALVEYTGDLGALDQRRYAQNPLDSQGVIINLPALENVNYAVVPKGIEDWFELVDTSVRANPSFLLPLDVAKNLDLRLPIYVGQLGGFYILEELEGYIDSSTIVKAKLIKLPRAIAYVAPVQGISLTTTAIEPNSNNGILTYLMNNSASFNNFVPSSATIKAKRLTSSLATGGVPSGFEFNSNINFGLYSNNITQFAASSPILASEQGFYTTQVTDSSGIVSNVTEVYLGPPPGTASVTFELLGDATTAIVDSMNYTYINHTPTSAVLHWRHVNLLSGEALDVEKTMNFPLTPLSGQVTGIDWDITAPGLKVVQIWLVTDQAETYGNEFNQPYFVSLV